MEKVEVIIKPVGPAYPKAYKVTFESNVPNAVANDLARTVARLLREEYIAYGVENIKLEI